MTALPACNVRRIRGLEGHAEEVHVDFMIRLFVIRSLPILVLSTASFLIFSFSTHPASKTEYVYLHLNRPCCCNATRIFLVSHRSCSDNESDTCFRDQLLNLKRLIAREFTCLLNTTILFNTLPEEIRHDTKWSKHTIPGLHGRGFWFWKPAILNVLLHRGILSNGDHVINMDTDMPHFLPRLCREDTGADISVVEQPHCEHQYTKGDVFEKFGTRWNDPQYGLTRQPAAGLVRLKINDRSRKFLMLWEELASDYHLISNEASYNRNADSPYLLGPRNDQSLMSMLLKASHKFTTACTPRGETQGIPTLNNYSFQQHRYYGISNLRVEILRTTW